MLEPRAKEVLHFWFGRVERTVIPTQRRARIWFGDHKDVDLMIRKQFNQDLLHAKSGDYHHWEESPHGQLALIIILDQFSRHIYRGSQDAYTQDHLAIEICLRAINQGDDHRLSLIERVFFYFPLLHSEHLAYQESAMQVYQTLLDLALPETKVIYESFFKFASHHYNIIRQFGRFPQRNSVLSRVSTKEEQIYLDQAE